MKDVQLEKLSIKQLRDLKGRVDRIISTRKREARKSLLTRIRKLAADSGIPLSEVVGKRRRRSKANSMLYINPDNAAESWEGRGRKPKWLNEKVKAGVSLDSMRVR